VIERVLVLWAGDRSPNLGVRVLASGTAQLARSAWGESVHVDYQDLAPSSSAPGVGGRVVAHDVGRANGWLKERLRAYDVIVDAGGGDSFTDIYGLKRFGIMHYSHRVAAAESVPMVMGPQTIGPFNTRVGAMLAKRSIRLMAGVVARDSVSAMAAGQLGRSVDAVATDVVFALPAPPRTVERDVVLNVSGLLWRSNGHVRALQYQQDVVAIARELMSSGRSVTLLAHVLANATADDDVPAILDAAHRLGGQVEVAIPADLTDARRILASARLVIGSRMHACLNALSVGTPAIGLAYSRKFAPLFADLGWSHTVDLTAADVVSSVASLVRRLSVCDLEDVAAVRSRAASRLTAATEVLASLQGARG
jgi:colanic acid/amylovoran biosynthesis protein